MSVNPRSRRDQINAIRQIFPLAEFQKDKNNNLIIYTNEKWENSGSGEHKKEWPSLFKKGPSFKTMDELLASVREIK